MSAAPEQPNLESYPFKNLGTHVWKVTTSSPDAQGWFDIGLAWAHGFNMDEAVMCFQRALDCDPSCLMGYVGVAAN